MSDNGVITLDRDVVRRNLFPAAHASVEPWEDFPWHLDRRGFCDTGVPHSSQALALDYFGTLKGLGQTSRDAVLERIASSIDLPLGGPWQIELEWRDPANLLNEPTRTQVDAIARSPSAIILFEAKFGERDGGCCSQTNPTKNGLLQCDGNYRLQTNPTNGISSKCALSGKGIRYWDIVPEVMTLDSSASYLPCPFASSWYQWMRNIVGCGNDSGENGPFGELVSHPARTASSHTV